MRWQRRNVSVLKPSNAPSRSNDQWPQLKRSWRQTHCRKSCWSLCRKTVATKPAVHVVVADRQHRLATRRNLLLAPTSKMANWFESKRRAIVVSMHYTELPNPEAVNPALKCSHLLKLAKAAKPRQKCNLNVMVDRTSLWIRTTKRFRTIWINFSIKWWARSPTRTLLEPASWSRWLVRSRTRTAVTRVQRLETVHLT